MTNISIMIHECSAQLVTGSEKDFSPLFLSLQMVKLTVYHSLVLPWNSQLDPQERFVTDGAEVPETDRYCVSTLYVCM